MHACTCITGPLSQTCLRPVSGLSQTCFLEVRSCLGPVFEGAEPRRGGGEFIAKPAGEVHLEQIGVSEQARGRGIGKKLMAWAHTTARDAGATFISLEVISVNRAKRLYEREGYVVTPNPEGDGCITWCFSCSFIWCCMCCRYTAVDYMVKQLKD